MKLIVLIALIFLSAPAGAQESDMAGLQSSIIRTNDEIQSAFKRQDWQRAEQLYELQLKRLHSLIAVDPEPYAKALDNHALLCERNGNILRAAHDRQEAVMVRSASVRLLQKAAGVSHFQQPVTSTADQNNQSQPVGFVCDPWSRTAPIQTHSSYALPAQTFYQAPPEDYNKASYEQWNANHLVVQKNHGTVSVGDYFHGKQ